MIFLCTGGGGKRGGVRCFNRAVQLISVYKPGGMPRSSPHVKGPAIILNIGRERPVSFSGVCTSDGINLKIILILS